MIEISMNLTDIAQQILARNNFIIVGHMIPDGDCIGSMLALYMGLQSIGKSADMLLQDDVPEIYRYLSCIENIKSPEQVDELAPNIIFLDCSDLNRAGEKISACLSPQAGTFNIDHHYTNELYADFNYVDSSAAATAEIIYELLHHMQVKFSPQIADALYTGIVMDTGSFQYSNTSSRTMRIAAELLEQGVNLDITRINLFESKPKEEVLLLGKALQYLDFTGDGKIAWMLLPYDDVKKIGALGLHPEGIINYTRMIKGVEVGLLFREVEPGMVKVGFRSKGKVDVAEVAGNFGGGGHKQAAGATQEGSLDEVKNRVISLVKNVVK